MAKGKLRKLFTNDEVQDALNEAKFDLKQAAKLLTKLGRGEVSRQLVRYWATHLETKKRNGEPYVGTTVLDRNIRNSIELRTPSPQDYMRTESARKDNSRILVIPDLHAPYHHQDALDFLAAVAAKYKPTRIVNLGDETDGHALSFHDSDPALDSAGPELHKARKLINNLARMFPVMDICHSNHGSLVYRKAFKSGIPAEYIKPYRDVLFPDGGGDGWEWSDRFVETLPNGETIIFQHQSSGDILANAAHERANLVQGHEHGKFEVQYRASTSALYFAVVSGCLIDHKSLAFAYGKLFPKKPILGCTVIIDSIPHLIPMILNNDGRWVGNLGEC